MPYLQDICALENFTLGTMDLKHREVNGNRVGRNLNYAQRGDKRGLKIGLGGTQLVHKEEIDGGLKIRLGGTQPMCGEEMEGGLRIGSRGIRLMCGEETEGGA
jgi:hypothetical protein